MININQGANESLVKKCKSLYDYVRLVGRISDNKKRGMKIGQAVHEAVDWAIKENFLEGFVREQKEEIIAMCLTEYDEESAIRGWKQDGIEEGMQQKAVETARNMFNEGIAVKVISRCVGLPLEQVLELQKELASSAAAN